MNNLNKENYFNQLHEKYPKAMQLFCDWIDRYKKLIEWDAFFVNGAPGIKQIKFHDIPYEMQYGILLRFFAEQNRIVFPAPQEAMKIFEISFASIENGSTYTNGTNDLSSPGANAIFMERLLNQLEKNNYTVDHDKANNEEELLKVAAALILGDNSLYPKWWDIKWIEKVMQKSKKERVAIAGALCAAQYDLYEEEEKLLQHGSD